MFPTGGALEAHTMFEHAEVTEPLDSILRSGLRLYRMDHQMTRSGLARALGMSVQDVRDIGRGKRTVSDYGLTAQQVADLLGVTLQQLLRACDFCQYNPYANFRCRNGGMA